MNIDMSEFHGTFFEESHEHLDEFERILMEMDLNNPDPEELDSIFRAAHSIKGGSGIFGFDALGQVTHVMENLLDGIRGGRSTLRAEMVDVLLSTSDTLRAILQSYRNQQEIDWAGAQAVTTALEALLEAAPADSKAGDNDGFGLFEEEDGFGFFADAAPTAAPEPEQGFGFFDDDPASVPAASHTPSAQVEDGFGLFVDEPEPVVATPAPAAAVNARAPRQTARSGNASARESASIRVDIAKVDQLVNLVGELVITQSMIGVIGENVEGVVGERLREVLSALERNTRELQESVMSVRMLPVSFVFNRFPRVVRDLATRMNKRIDLQLEGGDTEMDKGMIEKLVDPLTHLVRNSIDHGIEAPEVRLARGKLETGTVVLRAIQKGGNIVIEIEDDGAGLNRDRILAKAREKGLPLPENPTDQQVWKLILEPGFSTAEQITDVSGRGVGMDVVKRNLESLGGRLEIESFPGQGSRFTVQLPLTLAIIDGMGVKVGTQSFILPLVAIVESMRPEAKMVKTIGEGDYLIAVRDHYWPVIPLYQVMEADAECLHPADGIVVLIETGRKRFALLVDELLGQQQVVIKSLEQNYKRVHGVAGATIMGDGSVALILDVDSLAEDVNQIKSEKGLAV